MAFLMSGYYANNMDIKSDGFKELKKNLLIVFIYLMILILV